MRVRVVLSSPTCNCSYGFTLRIGFLVRLFFSHNDGVALIYAIDSLHYNFLIESEVGVLDTLKVGNLSKAH